MHSRTLTFKVYEHGALQRSITSLTTLPIHVHLRGLWDTFQWANEITVEMTSAWQSPLHCSECGEAVNNAETSASGRCFACEVQE